MQHAKLVIYFPYCITADTALVSISTSIHPFIAHHSAGVPLDGLLDLAVGASSQRLQQLVAVFQVVLVVVLLHARVASSVAAGRQLLGGDVGR